MMTKIKNNNFTKTKKIFKHKINTILDYFT